MDTNHDYCYPCTLVRTMSFEDEVRLAVIGFIVGVIGVCIGFLGFYVELRAVSVIGFLVTAFGIVIVFSFVLTGRVRVGRSFVIRIIKITRSLVSKHQ